MPEGGAGAYESILCSLLADGTMTVDDRILVQFAGEFDELVATRLGLTNCTFSNLEPASPSSKLPSAMRADAHNMDLPNASFDHVIGHAGLHHCSRPHQALYEMYRIARKTIVVVENQDSLLMRLACWLGLVGLYEFDAVADGGHLTGGVDGTGTPNYVYRWTRREIRKTVNSFDPGQFVPIHFYTEWLVSTDRALTKSTRRLLGGKGTPPRTAIVHFLNRTLNGAARHQGNIFGFTIRKDHAIPHTWIHTEKEAIR